MALRTLGLFAGVGGLELGLRFAFGCRTVGYVERDAYAASALVARMEDATLDRAPVWDDVRSFDGRPWRGKVDCVAGGFPCQDISTAAGRGDGLGGARSGLWWQLWRIIGEVEPALVCVENVAALTTRGLDRVLGGLSTLGFDAEWSTLGSGAVGAPHRRERLWLLAWQRDLADPDRDGLQGLEPSRAAAGSACGGSGAFWPPSPGDPDGWRRWLDAGGPPPALPRVRGAADGAADWMVDRTDRLRCLGNGVDPLAAACAFRGLAVRAGLM